MKKYRISPVHFDGKLTGHLRYGPNDNNWFRKVGSVEWVRLGYK